MSASLLTQRQAPTKMDWSDGYITEEYTFGYFPELSPGILRLECLSAGLAPPAGKPLRYLELGYGQGLMINMHAAAVPGEFWGTDFNPSQAAFARALADASGSGAVLLDDSFAELAERSDLPEFDIIALHGIWTWVSDENRRIIVDIIRRKLRVGGLVFISYNCLPGWGATAPLRHLIKLYGDLASSDVASMADRLDAGIKFTQQVIDAGALYFHNTPSAVNKLNAMAAQDKHYLSHEYFTREWQLMTFSDVARVLGDAKLTFAASGTMLNHIDVVNLHNEGQKLLAEITHPILRQSVRDYMANEQFRRDIFVKGPRRLMGPDRLKMLRAQIFVLIMNLDDIPMTLYGANGEAVLSEEIYRPVIEVMAEENYSPKTLGHLADHAKLKFLQFHQIFEALLVLVGANHARPAQEVANESRQRCTALNRYICERARSDGDIGFLVSPVTGSGIRVGRTEQLFLLAAQHGKKTVSETVANIWELMSAQDQCLVKDGKPLETPDENIAQLTLEATKFAEKRLPVLRALGIA
jgi:hypothetical protein